MDEGPVSKRRIIQASRIPGSSARAGVRDVVVCPRCNYGNFKGQELCTRCEFSLDLTREEEQSIERRLSGTGSQWVGVDSDSEEEERPESRLISDLKELPFFDGLGIKSLTKVTSALAEKRFSEGTEIIRQGEEGDAFCIIKGGRVRVSLQREDGTAIHVADLGPKEGFGEIALLTLEPRSAGVVATTDVKAWRLSREAFQSLLSENISLALYFNRVLSQRLRALQERIVP